jgi:hypothetical protein
VARFSTDVVRVRRIALENVYPRPCQETTMARGRAAWRRQADSGCVLELWPIRIRTFRSSSHPPAAGGCCPLSLRAFGPGFPGPDGGPTRRGHADRRPHPAPALYRLRRPGPHRPGHLRPSRTRHPQKSALGACGQHVPRAGTQSRPTFPVTSDGLNSHPAAPLPHPLSEGASRRPRIQRLSSHHVDRL